MATGIQVINDYGSTSIDENYKNYVFVTKGTINYGQYASVAHFTFTGRQPVMAVQPPKAEGRTVCVTYVEKNNGTYNAYFFPDTPNADSFDYYIFDTIPDSYNGTGLVQVRDASNRLTFDSNFKYLRTVDFIDQGSGRNQVLGGYREAAIVLTPGVSQEGGGGYLQRNVSGVQWNNGYLRGGEFFYEYQDTSDGGNNSDQNPSYSYPRAYMFIDVTGY